MTHATLISRRGARTVPVTVAEARVWAAAALAAVASAGELIGGGLVRSTALQAEALHTGAHASAFVLAAVGYAGARKLDGRGRGRPELFPTLAALLNGLLLAGLSAALAVESWGRLQAPRPAAFAPALTLALVGLIVTLILIALLAEGRRRSSGGDLNLGAVLLHMTGDAAVGVFAIVALLAGRWLGWTWADGLAGACGGALMLAFSVGILLRSGQRLIPLIAPARRPAGPSACG